MSVAELPPATVNEAAFIRQCKQICQDLMPHRPAIYWADFLVSISLAWTALIVYLNAEWFSGVQITAFVVTGLMLYRASVFTHELAHVSPSRFRAFRFIWNVLFGCPFLMPTFLYTDHRVHHTSQTYGTGGDAEYFPYGQRPFRLLVLSQLAIFILPLLPIIRFGLLGPLSLLHPKLRTWVWQRASSLGALSPSYRRAAPDTDERQAARWQEVVCSLVVFGMIAGLATGAMTWTAFGLILAVFLFAMMLNNFRVYAAHRYISTGEPMTFLEQMLDSTTIPTVPAALWAPLGMRYHALHHLFPAMPYHAMGTAHRRLMRQLPPNSPYHQTVVRSLPESILNLVRATRAHANLEPSPAGK